MKTVEHYITEKDIGILLEQLFPNKEIIHNKKHSLGFRPDYYIPESALIVEFDGYHHYTDNTVVMKDVTKDTLAKDNRFYLIRIPYFIQLHVKIVNDLFQIHTDIQITQNYNNYPLGFVDEKAALPGSFSSLGLLKYNKQLKVFGEYEIYKSLINKILYENKEFSVCFPGTTESYMRNTYNSCMNILNSSYTKEQMDMFGQKFRKSVECLDILR